MTRAATKLPRLRRDFMFYASGGGISARMKDFSRAER